jgi:hypothetical protein
MKKFLLVGTILLSTVLLSLAQDATWEGTPTDVTEHFLLNHDFEGERQSQSFGAKIYGWLTSFTWQSNDGSNFENLQVGYAEKWCNRSETLEDMKLRQRVKLPAGRYIISTDAWAIRQGQENSLYITGCYFMVGDERVAVNSGVSNSDKHYSIEISLEEDTEIILGAELSGTNANWVAFDNFCIVRDMVDEEAFNQWLIEELWLVSTPFEGNPVDVTGYFIKNFDFEGESQIQVFGSAISNWTGTFTWQNNEGSQFFNLVHGYAEKWCDAASALENMELKQTVVLTAGSYVLSVDASVVRQGQEGSMNMKGCFLVAGDERIEIGEGVNNSDNNYSLYFQLDGVAEIEIGIELVGTNANWVTFDNFSIVRDMVDEADETQFNEWLQNRDEEADQPVNKIVYERKMEELSRGVVAVPALNGKGNLVSWRFLLSDKESDAFNIYRDNVKLSSEPIIDKTNYLDTGGNSSSVYKVSKVSDDTEVEFSNEVQAWDNVYKRLKLQRPPAGSDYKYYPNDASVGDVDGDGEYEIILKWDPDNAKDNSHFGHTGNVLLDCYKLDGTFMWRIDLGKNIRAGAHYTQFMVYDLDGDGKAEVACKTAPGTIDGNRKYVLMSNHNPNADYRNDGGHILTGPEYLTVFNGETGAEITTIAYKPPRSIQAYSWSYGWGDDYGNRSERYLASVAYLDGKNPSLVMCKGYYTMAYLTAYDFDGENLSERWFHKSEESGPQSAFGQGNHSLSVADVDGDGCDEIIYGSATINNDGTVLYSSMLGHADALHVSDMDPDRDGLEIFMPQESSGAPYGFSLRAAESGNILFGEYAGKDVGRANAANIDSEYRGFEMWSTANGAVYSCKGEVISYNRPSLNFRVYWDGDLQDELLDGTVVDKWNSQSKSASRLFSFYNYRNASACNGSKNTPNLSADIFGDWREEVIYWNGSTADELLIFSTNHPSNYRVTCLMHDPVYRTSIAWQNVAYNQPPHLGYYLPDLFVPGLALKTGSREQTVYSSELIMPIVLKWRNAAVPDVDLPDGLQADVNENENTISISGSISESGNYIFSVKIGETAENDSVVFEGSIIVLELEKPLAPNIVTESGTYADSLEVVITNSVSNSKVVYSINDGEEQVYSQSFTLNESSVVSAYLVSDNDTSDVVTATYQIEQTLVDEVLAPVFFVGSGTYADSVFFSLSCETEGVEIFYVTDGGELSTDAIKFEEAFAYFRPVKISAIAVLNGDSSKVVSVNYKISYTTPPQIATPQIDVQQINDEDSYRVTITCDTEGSTIYYTVNGRSPSKLSTIYDGEFVVSETTTVKTIAFLRTYYSEIAEQAITIDDGGTFVRDLKDDARIYCHKNMVFVENQNYYNSELTFYSIDGTKYAEVNPDVADYRYEIGKQGVYLAVLKKNGKIIKTEKLIVID